MMKRNDGYALSYVLVVLLVLFTIAMGVTSISLFNLKNQKVTAARMQDKYAAQGMIEQVVAQLENAESEDAVKDVIDLYPVAQEGEPVNPIECEEHTIGEGANEISSYLLTATSGSTKITTEITLSARDANTPDAGYIVTYHSFDTEVTP